MIPERAARPGCGRAFVVALAMTFCAMPLGCQGSPAPPAPADPNPSPDEQVLLTLDCYNPMYKLDEDGHVTHLNLVWRHLPASALAEIDKLTELQGIDLAYSTVTDDGLAQLKDLQKLHNMGLAGTPVTDRGLAHLEKMQGLQWLWLPKERVSEAALEKLKEARPDMHIYLQQEPRALSDELPLMLVAVPTTPRAPAWRELLAPLVLASVLAATFALKLHNLGHTALTRWDEAYHAVVARNVLKHPLQPTLIDVPYVPSTSLKWSETHVWLHKPVLPFWQIALAFAVLGVNAFALRLPSAVLSTGAAWLTYLIGKELLDRRAGLVAAALQAANPFLLLLVHGYQFADHIDVALLFWVEVGMYFLARSLRTGCWGDVLLAGVAQGLAYLCKNYLAAIVFGLALTAWLLRVCRAVRPEACRIGPAHLFGLLGATVLTVAPWLAWCLTQYPREFGYEQAQVWKHVTSNVEGWGAPWDRVAFDYLIGLYGVFYAPVLVAGIVLLGTALSRRHTGFMLVGAWGLGVVLPHLLVATKTPSATVVGMPAFFLLLGCLIAEAWRGERWPLAALTGVLAMSFVFPAVIKAPGYGAPSPRVFAGVMRHSLWVVGQVGGALAFASLVAVAGSLTRRGDIIPADLRCRFLPTFAKVFCLCVLAWLGIETVDAAWRVTERNVNDPSCEEVGRFARDHLPGNAVLLCEERRGDEHLTTMFYADRTCYALGPWGPDDMARQVVRAGGIPYVVSRQNLPYASLFVTGEQGVTVYLWERPSRPLAGGASAQPVVYGYLRKQGLQDADAVAGYFFLRRCVVKGPAGISPPKEKAARPAASAVSESP